MKRHLLKYTACLFALAGFSMTAHAATLLVPGSHATVQAAVDAASITGDEIHITAAGTYAGAVFNPGKTLKIVGDVANVVIGGTVNNIAGGILTLENLTVTAAAGDGVAQLSTGTLTLTQCLVANNPLRGVFKSASGEIIINSSTLRNNGFDGFNCSDGTGVVTITDSTIQNNTNRAGIMVENGQSATINLVRTTLAGNNVGIWISGGDSMALQLNDSTLRNNPQDQILINKQLTITAVNTTFEHTTSPTFMAGIRLDSSAPAGVTSTVTLDHCTFTAPYNFNCLWLGHKTNLTVRDCSFDGYSSALNVTDNASATSQVSLIRSIFKGSRNVPVSLNGIDGNPAHVFTAEACRFSGGSTPFNLLNAVAAQASLTNCVFEGGDVQVWTQGDQAWLKLRNCTLAGDATTTAGVSLQQGSSQNLVANCIIDGTRLGLSAAATVTSVNNHHNLVRSNEAEFDGVTSGTATIVNVDPMFEVASTGPETGNFHLLDGSPAIDAGDATLGVGIDYDQKVRGGAIDLGAYEFGTPPNSTRHWNLY